jgi:hypothetical protein
MEGGMGMDRDSGREAVIHFELYRCLKKWCLFLWISGGDGV